MLTENDVILKLSEFLSDNDYEIIQQLNTNQKGIDIIAKNDSEVVYIEAKGETSSKSSSNRFGKPFNRNQIRVHIARAIFTCLETLSDAPSGKKTSIGLALPYTKEHQLMIKGVISVLENLNIRLYWVSKTKISVH